MCQAPVNNARRPRSPRPLRQDPSRTGTLRRAMLADVQRRFAALRRAVVRTVLTEDAFGLLGRSVAEQFATLTANAGKWQFQTDAQKVESFNGWLSDQVAQGVLQPAAGIGKLGADAWTGEYVASAYKQGQVRAYVDSHKEALAVSPDFYKGSQAQFLKDSFNAPETVSKLKLLGTRSYEGLKGITAAMSTDISRKLADGLAGGKHPKEIARDLVKSVDGIGTNRAKTLARTEIMHAHAEGQLDAFDRLGVEELGVLVEWSTAGDDRVCPLCQPLEGSILTIDEARGIIPRHPNCRCTWIPANVGEKTAGQKWTNQKNRVIDSVKEETGLEDGKQAREASTWAGADKYPKDKGDLKPTKAKQAAKAAELDAKEKAAAAKQAIQKAKQEAAAAYPDLDLGLDDLDDAAKLTPTGAAKLAEKFGLGFDEFAAVGDATSKATLAEQVAALKATAKAAADAKAAAELAAKKAAHSQKIKEGMAKAKAKKAAAAQAAKEKAELDALLGKYGGQMDGGQVQKVAQAATFAEKVEAAKGVIKEIEAAAKAAEEAAKAIAARVPAGLPNPATVQKVKDLPGSTRPVLVKDPSGQQWVMKAGLDPDHVRSEALADDLYKRAGLAVPRSGIVETAEGPVKFSEYLEGGETLAQWTQGKSAAKVKAMHDKIAEGFAADALFANHDVAGLSMDNIFVVKGVPYRIDNGGALAYRAQGLKKAEFGPTVKELASLRDPKINPNTAKIFSNLTDDDIHDQVRDLVARRQKILTGIEDAELRKTIAARLDYLEGQYLKQPQAVRAAGGRAAEYGVGPQTAARVQSARLNGVTLSGDHGDVEDLNVLAWGETDAAGKQVTRLQLKVTPQGSKKIEAVLADEIAAADKSAPAAQQFYKDDIFYNQMLPAIKTINHHAGDGAYNASSLAGLEQAKAALAAYKPTNPDGKAMVKHYQAVFKTLDDAIANKKTTPKIEPFIPKPKTAKPARSPYQVKTQDLEFKTANIRNGHAVENNGTNRFRGRMYKVDAGDGIEIRFSPNLGAAHERPGLALEGTVQITVPEGVSNSSLQKALSTLKSLGVDASPPSPEYEELLYLHRTIYQRKLTDDSSYQAIWTGPQSDAEKVKDIKKWVKTKMKIDLPDQPNDWYNPAGKSKTSYGDGVRYWERWDLPAAKIKEEMSDYRLSHWTSNLEQTIEGVLQSGGELTSTTGRIRKGVDISSTGGMSSSADMETGGASYFFTRITKASQPAGQLVFKVETLARQDAITYGDDRFGRISAIQDRKYDITGYKFVAGRGSNETIFKEGLSLLDDLDYIRTDSVRERERILKIFKDNKIDALPDGRKIEEVVR